MHGPSRESAVQALDALRALTDAQDVDVERLAADLAAVTQLLDREIALRRLLTEPSRPADARAALATELLRGKLGEPALDLVTGLVRSRWSRPLDLADTVDTLSVNAELAVAERAGKLDDVEDELFRFDRILRAEPELATALSERTPVAPRVALVDDLLTAKTNPTTLRLIERLVRDPRGQHVLDGLERYGKVAAERRRRLVALVTTVVPLTERQRTRLAEVLRELYGHEVHLNVEIDPEIVGGISVRIGDDVIDGTVATRLAEASRRIAA